LGHYHIPPVPSTLAFVDAAPLDLLMTGRRAVVEIVGYPDGQFRLVSSRVDGPPRHRSITQTGVLMFRDGNEAKDALDLLVDRISTAARHS
jgi:hypothetical protein